MEEAGETPGETSLLLQRREGVYVYLQDLLFPTNSKDLGSSFSSTM